MRIFRRRVGGLILSLFGPAFVRLLALTWRVQVSGHGNLESSQDGGGCLVAIWHGRLLVAIPTHGHLGWHGLVSPSDDGSLVMHLLDNYGFEVIRGSTNKQAASALRRMLTKVNAGNTLIVTPDGPRGPMHSVNDGLAWLARATGRSVVPCGLVASRAWRMKSWDRFIIPRPFSKVAVVYGEPVGVPEDAPNDQLAGISSTVQGKLIAAEQRGCDLLGVEPDW